MSVGKKLRFEILKRDGFRCRYCGAGARALLQVDHVIPVSRGGGDEPSNLVTSCQPCNSGKSDRPLPCLERALDERFVDEAIQDSLDLSRQQGIESCEPWESAALDFYFPNGLPRGFM